MVKGNVKYLFLNFKISSIWCMRGIEKKRKIYYLIGFSGKVFRD